MTDSSTEVYLVTAGDYDDYTVLAVLADLATAEKYVDLHDEHQPHADKARIEVRPVLTDISVVGPYVTLATDVHVSDKAAADRARHIFLGPLNLDDFNEVRPYTDGDGFNILTTGLLADEAAVQESHSGRISSARNELASA